MTDAKRALNDAELVQIYEEGRRDIMAVWKGGTQYHTYAVYDGNFEELNVHSISDEKGQPVSREEISESMDELTDGDRW